MREVHPTGRLRRRLFLGALAAIPLLGTAAVADALWLEPRWLKVRRLRLSNNPRCRFVHFTDLHFKGDRAWLEKVVGKINASAPEFVCFTGDLIEQAGHLPAALEHLASIQAPLYGIPGNHDYWSQADFAPIRETFAQTGGRWLENQSVSAAGGRAQIHGVAQVRQARVIPQAGAVNVLLIHYPAWVEAFAGHRFDVALAGHTHGGQVRLPGVGALVLPFDSGAYDLGLFPTPVGPLNVSSGVGHFYINARFNCRPEIVVVEV